MQNDQHTEKLDIASQNMFFKKWT